MSEKIQVWRDDRRTLIRSKFSQEFDLVVELWHMTDENAWLISPDTPITDFNTGRLIHCGPDDFPASFLGEYGTLNGNHGSCFARNLLIFDHGMSEKDLGAIVTDCAGKEYCLMQIPNPDTLLVHPLATGDNLRPDFPKFTGEKLFYNGRTIPVIASTPAQLYPSNRIFRNEFLVDGKTPLPKGELVSCTFLDRVLDYDVVSPVALVDMVRNTRGQRHFPEFSLQRAMVDLSEHEGDSAYDIYRSLPALLHYNVDMRHENGGACVIYRHTEIRQALTFLEALDVMSIWSGEFREKPVQEFYIPKTSPFALTSTDGRTELMDFTMIARFDKDFPADCMLSQQDCPDPMKQPDRFIRFSGNERRELGLALGYSLCHGLSADPAWKELRPNIYGFPPTWKMYPRIFRVEHPAAGWQVDTISYRQYFNPLQEPDATCFFCHHENDDLIVYLDFHKSLQQKTISLPQEVSGCRMEVVEKTDSVAISTCENTMNPQIVIDVTGEYGYIVLRFFNCLSIE